MDLICRHINSFLDQFISIPDPQFQICFDKMESVYKHKVKNLLIYIDKVINQSLNKSGGPLKFIHIHLIGVKTPLIQILAEFMAVKFFYLEITRDRSLNPSKYLTDKIQIEKAITKGPLQLPPGAKGNGRQYKAATEEKKKSQQRMNFYHDLQNLNPNVSMSPKVLINLLQRDYDHLNDIFDTRPYTVNVENCKRNMSYVVINSKLSRDKIDEINIRNDGGLLDIVETIILFDCAERQIHRKFNFNELNQWNKLSSNFKNLIILSFCDSPFKFHRLKNHLDTINTRYFLPMEPLSYKSYSILSAEINSLMGNEILNNFQILFCEEKLSFIWEHIKEIINSYEGLSELRSIKMMNIYSMVLMEELKEILINDIFNFSKPPEILTNETRLTLIDLSDETIGELKSGLVNLLNWIIRSNWRNEIINKIHQTTFIIIPVLIYNNKRFLIKLCNNLRISIDNAKTWFNFEKETNREVLILDYRDMGPFPYYISPNISENYFVRSQQVTGLFLRIFFEDKWAWTFYNFHKDMIKALKNPIRDQFFNWEELKAENDKLIPQDREYLNWDIENTYRDQYQSMIIKIKLEDERRVRTYHYSDLFIVEGKNESSLSVIRAEDLLDNDVIEEKYGIQLLEDIYSEFNIYERIANVEREQRELDVIKSNYDLGEEEAGRLWKILLKRLVSNKNLSVIYDEIKAFMQEKGCNIVSFNTFKNSWVDPDSTSLIPREKKTLRYLCEFLGLPITYFRIMRRLKNVEIQASRSNNKHMNNLLSDLINDGCFNSNQDIKHIIELNKNTYKSKHDFDEIGIGEEQIVNELTALVELLRPYLKLKRIEKIETGRIDQS